MGDGGAVAKKTIKAGAAGVIFDLFMQGLSMGLGVWAVTFCAVHEWIRI